MVLSRRKGQGVLNILRFNWPQYLISSILVLLVLIAATLMSGGVQLVLSSLGVVAMLSILLSLLVSAYIYDLSGLYSLQWLDTIIIPNKINRIVNINAGFDELSGLLKQKYSSADIIALDFYNPQKHTEASIKRARKHYPPGPGIMKVETVAMPLETNSCRLIVLFFAAHEIREDAERNTFFNELRRLLDDEGRVVVVEHQRDVANFIAYNIGFLHFLSRNTWEKTFCSAGLNVLSITKHTPFVNIYTLSKHGSAS